MGRFFHLKCQVVRRGDAYGSKKKALKSIHHQFLSKDRATSFTVGSDQNDSLQIKGIQSHHAVLMLSRDSLKVNAGASLEIVTGKGARSLSPGEIFEISLLEKGKYALNFKIDFPEGSSIRGKVKEEEETLSPKALAYLESQHGMLKKVWEGGSGLFYKTRDQKVLKILWPSYARSTGVTTRFINAARKFQLFSGDSFFKIWDVVYERPHGLCYVVMEYVSGDSLANYIASKGTIDPGESEQIVGEVAQRLALLQKSGYCFRNLSPENVLIDKNGKVRLCGFFLLKDPEAHLTVQGARMTINNYTAPEQIEDPSQADIKADIFSLGATFHTLLTGVPPFDSENPAQYLLAVTSKAFDECEIRQAMPDVPEKDSKLIAAMLSLKKERRPSPEEVIRALFPSQELLSEQTPQVELRMSSSYASLPKKKEDEKGNGYCVEILAGPSGTEKREYYFAHKNTIRIGKEGDILLPFEPKLLKNYAEIEIEGEKVWLTGLPKSEGNIVLEPEREAIEMGKEIRLGETVFSIRRAKVPLQEVMDFPQKDILEESLSRVISFRVSASVPVAATRIAERVQKAREKLEAERTRKNLPEGPA